jgi:hypothetical protein
MYFLSKVIARSQTSAVVRGVAGLHMRKDEKEASLESVIASTLQAARRSSRARSRRTMSAKGPVSIHSRTGRMTEKIPRRRLIHSSTRLRVAWEAVGSGDDGQWGEGEEVEDEVGVIDGAVEL